MNAKTVREKLLLIALPTVLILLFYAYKMSGLNTNWTAAESAFDAAKKSQPIPAQIAAQQKQVADLSYDLNEALSEQKRIRAMLNNMGIHLL